MYAPSQNNAFPPSNIVLRCLKIGDNKHLQIITSNCPAQNGTPEDTLTFYRVTDLVQKVLAVCISVRIAHSDKHGIVIMFKRYLKAESIKIIRFLLRWDSLNRRKFSLNILIICIISIYFAERLIVLVVCNIVPCSIPPKIMLLRIIFRVENRAHTVIKLRIRLYEIDYMECVLPVFSSVTDLEIKPLSKIFGVVIRFQNKLIFTSINLNCFFQISRFKSRLKD